MPATICKHVYGRGGCVGAVGTRRGAGASTGVQPVQLFSRMERAAAEEAGAEELHARPSCLPLIKVKETGFAITSHHCGGAATLSPGLDNSRQISTNDRQS